MTTRRREKAYQKQEMTLKPNSERKAFPAAPITEIKV
jgi:hypothetical protein